jgi:GNAT superfamily N-acetyltransferase
MFLRAGALECPPEAPETGLVCQLWKPSLFSIWPSRISTGRRWWFFWWVLHISRMFTSREYCALLVWDGDVLAHYAIVSPRWFRVPACPDGDLIVGPIWTETKYRGRGIASWVLLELRYRLGCPGRQFWYIVGEGNVPSQIAAIRCGFHLFAVGKRVARLGIRCLGKYIVTSAAEDSSFPGLALQPPQKLSEHGRNAEIGTETVNFGTHTPNRTMPADADPAQRLQN